MRVRTSSGTSITNARSLAGTRLVRPSSRRCASVAVPRGQMVRRRGSTSRAMPPAERCAHRAHGLGALHHRPAEEQRDRDQQGVVEQHRLAAAVDEADARDVGHDVGAGDGPQGGRPAHPPPRQAGGPQSGRHERDRQVDAEQLDRTLRRDGHLRPGPGQRRTVVAGVGGHRGDLDRTGRRGEAVEQGLQHRGGALVRRVGGTKGDDGTRHGRNGGKVRPVRPRPPAAPPAGEPRRPAPVGPRAGPPTAPRRAGGWSGRPDRPAGRSRTR